MLVKADSTSLNYSFAEGGFGKIISVLFLVVSYKDSGTSSSGKYPLMIFSK